MLETSHGFPDLEKKLIKKKEKKAEDGGSGNVCKSQKKNKAVVIQKKRRWDFHFLSIFKNRHPFQHTESSNSLECAVVLILFFLPEKTNQLQMIIGLIFISDLFFACVLFAKKKKNRNARFYFFLKLFSCYIFSVFFFNVFPRFRFLLVFF